MSNKKKTEDALKQLSEVKQKKKKRTEQFEEEFEEVNDASDNENRSDGEDCIARDSNSKKRKKNDNKMITTYFSKKDKEEEDESSKISPPHKRQRPIDEVLQDLTQEKLALFDPNAPTTVTILPKAELPDIPELQVTSSDTMSFKCARDKDGSILLYWLDATEIGGRIYLIGKVREYQSNRYISCCVTISELWRQCFLLLPDDEVDEDLVQEHVTKFAKSNSISGSYRFKVVSKQYCFEEPGVPYGEHKYIEFRYPLWEGDNKNRRVVLGSNSYFKHLFGANQSPLELFLLQRKIKGPCWLQISGNNLQEIESTTIGNTKDSYCRVEFLAQDAEKVSVYHPNNNEPMPNPPPVTIMSFKVKTVYNEESKANEIVMASLIVHNNVLLNGPTPNLEANLQKITIARKLHNSDPDFDTLEVNEKSLLGKLMAKINRIDPDIITGHNFLAFDLDVLLHRLQATKVNTWAMLGRLRRKIWPKLQGGAGGMGESTFAEKSILSGRLMCDTYLAAIEYLREKDYGLRALAESQKLVSNLPVHSSGSADIITLENNIDIIKQYLTSQEGLASLISHLELDAYLSLLLSFKLTMIPLTLELTAIAGNLWSRTLSGSRSERIEYLLLHEFYNRGYLVPDKRELTRVGGNAKRKALYSGGLVLDPKRGLYDRYVLLLDFNSLYPSIIIENQICFTTVDRPRISLSNEPETSKKSNKSPSKSVQQDDSVMHDDDDDDETQHNEAPVAAFQAELPNLQTLGDKKPVLPEVIKALLDRRRAAQKLMKNEKDEMKKWQYDVKQKALKLTANSTYGCLGFVYSRFYCQAIAELITRTGRNILSDTKNQIESKLEMSVIYGDTDSVMVLTTHQNYYDAYDQGKKIQETINKRHKFLEIGIDGLFRRILLLRKKKYVAIVHHPDSTNPNKMVEKVENKGLDMVRRDWCELSRSTSQFCVDQILQRKKEDDDEQEFTEEDVVNAVHSHLQEIGKRVREECVQWNDDYDLEPYILSKGLTKSPEDYPDARIHPHVQVAIEMRKRGLPVRVGQRIPYVICAADEDKKDMSVGERAVHPDVFRQSAGNLKLDADWYLAQQVYPPVMRLCSHMTGTDASLLAECLGLDKNRYRGNRSTISSSFDDYVMMNNDDFETDDEQFRACVITPFNCLSCSREVDFDLFKRIMNTYEDTSHLDDDIDVMHCNHCHQRLHTSKLINHVHKNIRDRLQQYYSNWLAQPHKAGARSRVVSLTREFGVVNGKVQSMRVVFPAELLHKHLQFYRSLFDWDRYKRKCLYFAFKAEGGREKRDRMESFLRDKDSSKRDAIDELNKVHAKVLHFLERCERNYVNLNGLFSFQSMKISN